MSRGSPRVTVRLKPLLLEEIRKAMESANYNRQESPYTISDWIVACIIDRLKHLERARKCTRKRPRSSQTSSAS